MADDFKFNIEQQCGVLSESKTGWKVELNLVSWGDRPAKYDIRSWSPDHEKMGKGVTLSKEDLATLKKILDGMDFN